MKSVGPGRRGMQLFFIPRHTESRNRSDGGSGLKTNERAHRSGIVGVGGKLVVIVAAFHREEMGPAIKPRHFPINALIKSSPLPATTTVGRERAASRRNDAERRQQQQQSANGGDCIGREMRGPRFPPNS